jgi:tetratricopeptide (TPR) repeat protein
VLTHYNAQAYKAALAASQRFQQTLAAEFNKADLVLHAHLHTTIGEPQQAVALYTQMLKQAISSAAIYNNRGYAYNMLADYLLAIQDFNQALALQPNMAYAYNNRGLALLRLGMGTEGRADIERSLRIDHQNAYAHRNLGIYHFNQGDYPAALLHFEQAHRLGTAPPELADYLTQTRQQLGLDPSAGEQSAVPFSDN